MTTFGLSDVFFTVKKNLFYIVLSLHMILGGIVALFGIIPFRPFYTSLLVFILIFVYRLKINLILKFHLLFSLFIVISCVVNGGGLNSLMLGLRLPIISYTMYLVVDGFFDNYKDNIEKLVEYLALFQLPIVIIQLLFYNYIQEFSSISIHFFDIRFGTFFVKSDPTMSTFLILVVIYLLFVKQLYNKWNMLIVISACLSVFLASSRISQITLLLIICYFLFIQSTNKQKLYSLPILVSAFLLFTITGYLDQLYYQFNQIWQQLTFQSGVDWEAFREGGYARGATILYFISEPLKIMGDGPGQYVNPLASSMELSLQGEYLKTYAELGIIGLMFSICGIFLIVFSCLKKGFYRYLIALTIFALGITSNIYNDAGLMFVFYLMLYLILNYRKKYLGQIWLIRN